MDVVVTGIGLLSTLGNLQETWRSILAGRSGIHIQQPFPELSPLPLARVANQPTNLRSLTHQILADALADAGLTPPLVDCGVVIGSSRGNQGGWEQLLRQPGGTTVTNWLDHLPNVAAVQVARSIQTQAIVSAPTAACATGIWAIAQGAELIRTGQCQRVIAGAVEAPITPLTIAGFSRMGALAQTGAYPFDRDREGFVLGEGGAFLVLESEELARSRQAKIYGNVLQAGLTADAYHLSAPNPEIHTAVHAVKLCCDRSGLAYDQIDFIHAHGTATTLNDRTEANILHYLGWQSVPVSSTKGATGHTLGASGAIGVTMGLMTLQQQTFPPCVGLDQTDFALNLVRVDPINTSPNQPIHTVLCFSFGFGGQNAAIALNGIQLKQKPF
ncbi:beta-ketoacyl-ACP synthase [Alkalinema pantanalense CENA528]|uniref:beta-ketoacyl-ACP synthase n=1 Tax=Alkalinema pantanalense TaxID=1620705 RepID=UPI003D6EA5EF